MNNNMNKINYTHAKSSMRIVKHQIGGRKQAWSPAIPIPVPIPNGNRWSSQSMHARLSATHP